MTSRSPDLDWKAAIDRLRGAGRIAITSHVRPDTDGIGSAIALRRWLTSIGKEARVLLPEALPAHLAILDPDGVVEAYAAVDADFVASACVVVLDVSERERLGPLARPVAEGTGSTICIDHHINKDRRFADVNVIDPGAPSTGVLVWELFAEAGWEPDLVAVQSIYATLVSDTGSFRYSNTSSAALRLAAELVDRGAEPQRISRAVLSTYTPQRLRLLSRALGQLQLDCDARLAWCAVSRELLDEVDASVADSEGIVEYLRLLASVRTAVFFIEIDGGRVKISFRSEEGYDVNALATRWGGGGHRHASGAVIAGPLPAVVDEVIDAARGLFA